MRNVEEVPTELLAVDDVVRTLPPGVREALTRDLFDVAAPDSNDALTDGERMTLSSAPVLELVREGYRARFDVGTTEGRTPEAEQALEAWEDALKKAEALQPILRPGDFLGFDNTLLMHKRGGFEPEPGNERWLRRCYASR